MVVIEVILIAVVAATATVFVIVELGTGGCGHSMCVLLIVATVVELRIMLVVFGGSCCDHGVGGLIHHSVGVCQGGHGHVG